MMNTYLVANWYAAVLPQTIMQGGRGSRGRIVFAGQDIRNMQQRRHATV